MERNRQDSQERVNGRGEYGDKAVKSVRCGDMAIAAIAAATRNTKSKPARGAAGDASGVAEQVFDSAREGVCERQQRRQQETRRIQTGREKEGSQRHKQLWRREPRTTTTEDACCFVRYRQRNTGLTVRKRDSEIREKIGETSATTEGILDSDNRGNTGQGRGHTG